jgi:carbamoyl-phosphate synthase small subunit
MRDAWLTLDDGRQFAARVLVAGRPEHAWGEVVFNTALTGYQEILTDPSYAGQFVVLTYPLIGNYGVDPAWAESLRPAARGLVVRQLEPTAAARPSLYDYCRRYDLWLLTEVDTRALTRHLRQQGTRRGLVVTDASQLADAPAWLRRQRFVDLVDSVSTPASYEIPGPGPRVTLMDYGVKQSILQELKRRGAHITVLPSTAGVAELDATRPDAVVLSNGPGDPADLTDRLAVVRHALDRYPTLGICLGHQLVGLAAGGRTFALKFGHHGANHPVLDHRRGQVSITSQNHGYAVDPESLGPEWDIRFVNLHDGTVEGLMHRARPVLTVQHHPEAGPGPHDARYVFDEFLALVGQAQPPSIQPPGPRDPGGGATTLTRSGSQAGREGGHDA